MLLGADWDGALLKVASAGGASAVSPGLHSPLLFPCCHTGADD